MSRWRSCTRRSRSSSMCPPRPGRRLPPSRAINTAGQHNAKGQRRTCRHRRRRRLRFRAPGFPQQGRQETRFHSIWDQGGTLRPPPKGVHLRFAHHQTTHGCGHCRREEARWFARASARVAVATGAGLSRHSCRQHCGGQQGRVPGVDDCGRAHRCSAARRTSASAAVRPSATRAASFTPSNTW